MQQTQRHNAEMQRLRKRLARVTEERDLLKKAAA
jgi:transposase-like protein